jgi:hypothetical protein
MKCGNKRKRGWGSSSENGTSLDDVVNNNGQLVKDSKAGI